MKFLLSCIFLLFTFSSFATIIKGSVKDNKNNPIPFALVRADSTSHGVTTNESGMYEMDLPPGDYTLICEYMGYRSEIKKVTVGNEAQTINFKLTDQQYSLDEVVIKAGEDPAIRKMRAVIEKRKYHADLIKTLSSEIYLKGNLKILSMPDKILGQEISDSDKVEMGLENDKGIIYLLEQVSAYNYKAPNKQKTFVKSVRTSGDDQGVGFAQMPPIINIYENNINLLGLNERGFISPANNNAFMYYNFKFEGSYFEDNRMISKIRVTPKRKYEPTFTGFVYVVEDEWVFKSVQLSLTRDNGINLLDTIELNQIYTPKSYDLWVIQSQNIVPFIQFFGVEMGGEFITNYQNTIVNEPIADELFESNIISSYDTNAMDRSLEYWDTARAIPLTAEEERDFVKKDSMATAAKNKYDSTVFTKVRWNLGLSSWLMGNPGFSYKNYRFQLNPLLEMLNYNTVEGTNITLKPTLSINLKNNRQLILGYDARYGWSSEKYYQQASMKYKVESEKRPAKRYELELAGGQYIADITGLMPLSFIYNTFTTLLYGGNYLKFYEKNYLAAKWSHSLGNGFSYAIRFDYEDRSKLGNTTSYLWRKQFTHRLTPNNPENLPTFVAHQASILSLSASYQPGWKYIQYPKKLQAIPGSAPTFTAAYTKGIKGLFGSDVDFDKWKLGMSDYQPMKMAGSLIYNLSVGGFLNKEFVGNPDYMHIRGNQTILASEYLNSFQIAPYYRFSNVAPFYFNGHAEWHLNGLISNKLPIFRQFNWHFVTGSNTLYIDSDDYYAEVFFGVENIGWKLFRILRVDAALGYEAGRKDPSFGIRLGLNSSMIRAGMR